MIDMRRAPSWEHEPVGPFRLIVTDMERFIIEQWSMFDTLNEALEAWLAGVIPIRPNWGATVTDRDDYVVAAHNSCPHWEIHWLALQATIDTMRAHQLIDPIDLELIAIEAELPWREDDG